MPPVPREAWTDAVRDVFAVYEGEAAREAGSKFNIIRWFANHPSLAQNWLRFSHDLTRGVFDPRLGRRRNRVHFLDPDPALFVHPKILVTRSIPRASASTSAALL